MFDTRILIVIIFLVLIIFFILSILYIKLRNGNQISLLKLNKSKCFVINLEKNTARLDNFLDSFNHSDLSPMGVQRFNAILGKNIDLKQYVTERAYTQIISAEKNGYRLRHYELTRGAVGCFLSHTALYKKLLNDPDADQYIIFEDDAYIPPDTLTRIVFLLENAPKEWDILMFGVIRGVPVAVGEIFTQLKTWWGLYGYVINKKGAKKFMDEFNQHMIDMQIDSLMSLMAVEDRFNAYASRYHIIKHNASGTDIQLPVRLALDVDPYLYDDVELYKNY